MLQGKCLIKIAGSDSLRHSSENVLVLTHLLVDHSHSYTTLISAPSTHCNFTKALILAF